MSGGGGRKNDDNDNNESGGGWASTFLKIAGAAAGAAAVAGSLYGLLKQPKAKAAPFEIHTNQEEEEEVILNVDGSRLHDIPSTGCGGVLTDATTGKWICGFAQKLNPNLKVNETEKEAILRGLIWVKEKGKKKVTVKSDNEGVVYLVNCGVRSSDPIVCGIREILNSFEWDAKLIITRDDENGVADKLAHKAHRLSSFDLHQYDYPPQNCVSSFN